MAPLSPTLSPSLDPAAVATLTALAKIITVGSGGTSLTIKIGSASIEISSAGDIILKSPGAMNLSAYPVNINDGALEVR